MPGGDLPTWLSEELVEEFLREQEAYDAFVQSILVEREAREATEANNVAAFGLIRNMIGEYPELAGMIEVEELLLLK